MPDDMPGALQAASEHVRLARLALSSRESERDKLIRSAHAEGWSLRKIAAEAGVSFARVAQIVNQEEKS
jgi:lambda repressor-like predicted transcriptional regulator